MTTAQVERLVESYKRQTGQDLDKFAILKAYEEATGGQWVATRGGTEITWDRIPSLPSLPSPLDGTSGFIAYGAPFPLGAK